MPSGGARPNAGRKKGSRNSGTVLLEQWMAPIAGTFEARLTAVAEDDNIPLRVRLEALRRLFGLFAARIVKSAPNEEGISA